MDFHNANEGLIAQSVQKIFDEIQDGGNPDNYCLCYQCRVDTICFTLNRVPPNYIVSNRGFDRIDLSSIKGQQMEADITSLIYKGLRLVNHNQRPTSPHDGTQNNPNKIHHPLFDVPTISGRIFNGISFEPIVGIEVFIYLDGELIPMRNANWQNPFTMVPSTPGVFSFWPKPITAEAPDINREFKFSIRVKSPDFEPLNHFFSVSSTSKFHNPQSHALNRTFKLPDLYLFPPGGDEEQDLFEN
jgi:competence protein ComFB